MSAKGIATLPRDAKSSTGNQHKGSGVGASRPRPPKVTWTDRQEAGVSSVPHETNRVVPECPCIRTLSQRNITNPSIKGLWTANTLLKSLVTPVTSKMGSLSSFLPARGESPIDISKYPKLDHKQAGHLRHLHNLVSQPDGEWHHFGCLEEGQELDDAYRYQLATMAYATGLAHYHHLPAMRGPLKQLFRSIIHKMLLRQVWGYWFNTSHGGFILDPDLPDLRPPWADPVIKENIMYSGHLLLMTSLYAMLFDDDEFEKEGSLTFRWNPLLWGRRQDFVYDNRSLQKVIFQQMEENDWVGVCCEPNAVFVVCNQFPVSNGHLKREVD